MAMRAARSAAVMLRSLLGLAVLAGVVAPSSAQETWNPFKQWPETQPPRTSGPPSPKGGLMTPPGETPVDRANLQPEPRFGPRDRPVERSELAPVMAPDSSGMPLELWRGIDLKTFEELLSVLDLPPRSPSLHRLWRRMLLSAAPPPAGAPSPDHFLALRLEALYRSGLLSDMTEVIGGSVVSGPLIQVLGARKDIGLGRRDAGCAAIKALAAPSSGLPGRLKGETQLLAGYCAAAAGDAEGAGLAASLAREEGVEAELPLSVLGGIATGTKPRLALPKRVLLLDYRFLELLGPVNAAQIFEKAEPALLSALAADGNADRRLQVAAAEAALRLNALTPEAVADVYRRQAGFAAGDADPTARTADPLLRRALLFRGVELSRSPPQQARMARALLDDARRSGVLLQTAQMLAPVLADMPPSGEPALAEVGVEIAIAAGRFERARRWAETAGAGHWLALIDVADAGRRGGRVQTLGTIEQMAMRGRLSPDTLHRLATVLDALDIDVPIPLWDAASRTPQPSGGYLPETGVLADLAQSAKRNDAGRTLLLAMRTLGADGPEGANVIALGDAIRALRRIGLEAEARRLGVEALLPVWPRMAGN
ncbi:MAG: hypothetical protein F9K29_18670 [Hyphomicrobiaceae bacterium]|nr:MAG: hypothetical protein F9K29_18670 [Hyphomicrobiaceae bacterium]